jgi:hypothetical protein
VTGTTGTTGPTVTGPTVTGSTVTAGTTGTGSAAGSTMRVSLLTGTGGVVVGARSTVGETLLVVTSAAVVRGATAAGAGATAASTPRWVGTTTGSERRLGSTGTEGFRGTERCTTARETVRAEAGATAGRAACARSAAVRAIVTLWEGDVECADPLLVTPSASATANLTTNPGRGSDSPEAVTRGTGSATARSKPARALLRSGGPSPAKGTTRTPTEPRAIDAPSEAALAAASPRGGTPRRTEQRGRVERR